MTSKRSNQTLYPHGQTRDIEVLKIEMSSLEWELFHQEIRFLQLRSSARMTEEQIHSSKDQLYPGGNSWRSMRILILYFRH